MEGLQWRADLLDSLHLVGQEGGVTVWTADVAGLRRLVSASTPADFIAGGRYRRSYTAAPDRHVRVSGGRTASVEFRHKGDSQLVGLMLETTGRPVQGGILADVKIRNLQLIAMHPVVRREVIPSGSSATEARAEWEIPEVIKTTASGSWLIPKGGVLIVGLGVHTIWGYVRSRFVTSEELVVIDGGDVPASAYATPVQTPPTWWAQQRARLAGPPGGAAVLLGVAFLAGWFVRGLGPRVERWRSRTAGAGAAVDGTGLMNPTGARVKEQFVTLVLVLSVARFAESQVAIIQEGTEIILFDFGGVAVASLWSTMAVLGQWCPEPTWTDRLGRLLGTAWVVSLASVVFLY